MGDLNGALDVSVIVRTKDRPILLGRALKSLAKQTSKRFEVIIINDGGNADPVENILAGVQLPEQILISNPESIGRAKAFNQALRMARGDFIACLDDDDTFEPKFIERMARELRNEIRHDAATGGIICRCMEIYEELLDPHAKDYFNFEAQIKQVKSELLFEYNSANNYVSPYFYYVGRENFLPVQTLFTRALLLEFGGFSERNDVLEDRPVYSRIVAGHRIAVLDECIANHHTRVSKGSAPHSNSMHDNSSYNWSKRFSEFYTEGYYDRGNPQGYQFAITRDALLDLKWDLTSNKTRREEFDYFFRLYWLRMLRLVRRHKLITFALVMAWVLQMIAFSAIGAALVLHFS